MTPFYADDWLTVYGGDCLEVMRTMPADSVDCVVTSPPYWGLRDYGNDGQLGLERTPEEYVANMVAVFREVRRVLKPSGTCWLNLGDSYSGNPASGGERQARPADKNPGEHQHTPTRLPVRGLKPKDLVGIPWRVAFALQADGWYLRSDIIWAKPNPMPESVTDRPTKAHEYLFLLTKSARYYFDADAVREANSPTASYGGTYRENGKQHSLGGTKAGLNVSGRTIEENPAGRNIRSVWTIATRPYPGAHFAVFPPELPERCIKAGSSEKGVCPECGAPWERMVETTVDESKTVPVFNKKGAPEGHAHNGGPVYAMYRNAQAKTRETTGWKPTCDHQEYSPEGSALIEYAAAPATILDPFAGSGTVGMVANRLSRRAILIDLNPEYLKQQMKRNAQTPLGLDVA